MVYLNHVKSDVNKDFLQDVWMMQEPCNNMAIKFYECVRPRDRDGMKPVCQLFIP